MKRLARPFGLRLRDAIFLCLIWVSAGSAVVSTWLFWRSINRYVIPCASATRDALALSLACSNYCSAISFSSASSSSFQEVVVPTNSPVVLGYGQTRSPKFRYIYRDTKLPTGEVKRDYIARYPLDN